MADVDIDDIDDIDDVKDIEEISLKVQCFFISCRWCHYDSPNADLRSAASYSTARCHKYVDFPR